MNRRQRDNGGKDRENDRESTSTGAFLTRWTPCFRGSLGSSRTLAPYLGNDWWPYGIEANREALEALLRYHFEQGITERLFRIEGIFVPELLTT